MRSRLALGYSNSSQPRRRRPRPCDGDRFMPSAQHLARDPSVGQLADGEIAGGLAAKQHDERLTPRLADEDEGNPNPAERYPNFSERNPSRAEQIPNSTEPNPNSESFTFLLRN